jgi:hypothetical protein
MTTFRPGDRIEFWSGDRGGCWKPGVVVRRHGTGSGNVRIQVGDGVWIVRPAKKCRLAAEDVLTAGLRNVPGTCFGGASC